MRVRDRDRVRVRDRDRVRVRVRVGGGVHTWMNWKREQMASAFTCRAQG